MKRQILSIAGAGALALGTAVAATAAARDAGRPAAHAARTHVVRLGEYYFRPKQLTIHAGDRVRFVNTGKIEHTVADSTKGGTIRSKIIHPRPLKRGRSQTVTLRAAGTVYYLCTFHPSMMRGVITVR
jgi:plastocyanin